MAEQGRASRLVKAEQCGRSLATVALNQLGGDRLTMMGPPVRPKCQMTAPDPECRQSACS